MEGREHATNVTIECNAGVYLSAMKPVINNNNNSLFTYTTALRLGTDFNM